MVKQLFYEDIQRNSDIPILIKHTTNKQLVKWAGASGDYYPAHYDKDFAQSLGLPGVIVHGWLGASFLGQLITDWIGDEGTLKKLSCKYRGILYPEEDAICKGRIIKKYSKDGGHFVELEIWVDNPKGERVILGSAVVILPSRLG